MDGLGLWLGEGWDIAIVLNIPACSLKSTPPESKNIIW